MAKKVKIYDMEIDYETVFRNIKYPRIEFKTGKLLLILPKGYREEDKLIEKHKRWIYKKSLIIRSAKEEAKNKDIKAMYEKDFRKIVTDLVNKFSDEINVKVNKIYFRELKTKWGSCSPRKNLTFNKLMRYLPLRLIEYIVFHEMIHLKEKNHNDRFWELLSKKFKDYKEREHELLVYWFALKD
jgi:predicted metal-dependent hydrolase